MSDKRRHTPAFPCPICDGHDALPQGKGVRCAGFSSDVYTYCTREEHAGALSLDERTSPPAYRHWLGKGECHCGVNHSGVDASPRSVPVKPQIVATYDYVDAHGALLYQTVRYQPKGFRQRRPDGAGGWIWKLENVRRVLYRLPELLAADPGQTVYLVEGEKDADALHSLGLVATTNAMGAQKWRPEYTEQLAGRHVVILPDADDAGNTHVETVAPANSGTAASLRVVRLPGLGPGEDVSDWLARGGTAPELERLVAETPEWEPSAAITARTIEEVTATFRKWLYIEDPGLIHVVLGAVAANYAKGDPLWLMVVGASSSGKTEVLMSAAGLDSVHLASTLTEASLLSGTPKKDAADGARGGLLREIGDFGIIIAKDFTSVLSMPRDPRTVLLAALREIFDGAWQRHIGTDGGRTLSWRGKVGIVGACTAAWDTHHAAVSQMGERFLIYRPAEVDALQQAPKALGNRRNADAMRQELADAVIGLFAGVDLGNEPPDLSEDEIERLVALSALIARCRSAVERNGYSRDIELVLDTEAPARLTQQLGRLYDGLRMIGLSDAEAWSLVIKTGFDCLPKLRRSLFDVLIQQEPGELDTTALALKVEHPTNTTRRALEELAAHHVVIRKSHGKGKADTWSMATQARDLYYRVETLPEKSDSYVPCNKEEEEARSLIPSDFSGTPSEDTRWSTCWKCRKGVDSYSAEPCTECGWLICPDCFACDPECVADSATAES